MLEVGPGDGALTARLAVLGRPLAAVELDPAMAHVSRRRLAELRQPSSAIIIEDDILDIDPAETLAAAGAAPPWGLVGNLPYAITAPLLRRFLAETPSPPEWMLIMVQHEVAQRIAAPQGKRSLLSVSVQFYAEAEYLFAVDRESFNPPPKVRSAVVRLEASARCAGRCTQRGALLRGGPGRLSDAAQAAAQRALAGHLARRWGCAHVARRV